MYIKVVSFVSLIGVLLMMVKVMIKFVCDVGGCTIRSVGLVFCQ